MIVFPNIKINLGLFITGKRSDGFHNIESVFYPVQWYESLELLDAAEDNRIRVHVRSEATVNKLRFRTYGNEIPGVAKENLCVKVYELLEQWYNLPPTDIHLLKTLPIGAGLGSGSADAAFTLKAFQSFFDLNISDQEAMELLGKVGSDCPFFWKNKPMFVFGRGEKMHPIDLDLSNYYVLLINPNLHVSTRDVYAGITPNQPLIDLHLLPDIDVENWADVVVNDFESSVFKQYPKLKKIKLDLYKTGALYASMTGSGSTLFGIYKHEPELLPKWSDHRTWRGKLTV
ncbi:MAG: hypothetical protein WEC59_11285 [Salibacteraceae bacterium]